MAKSTGNLVLVEDLLAHAAPAALRMLLLNRRYAEAWSYDPAQLDVAQDQLERLYAAAGRPSATGVDRDLALEPRATTSTSRPRSRVPRPRAVRSLGG